MDVIKSNCVIWRKEEQAQYVDEEISQGKCPSLGPSFSNPEGMNYACGLVYFQFKELASLFLMVIRDVKYGKISQGNGFCLIEQK